MSSALIEAPPETTSGRHILIFLFILALAAALRLHALGVDSLWHDELWGMEVTVGHDVQQSLLPPTGILSPAPDLLSLNHAAPWWSIWTHMHGDTHPPVYHTMLRFWQEMFGSGEVAVRSMSVIWSLVAIIAFFDAMRILNGPAPALWGCLLMAMAAPQIQYAQEARSYVPLLAQGMIAVAAVVRLEKRGPTLLPPIILALAVLAMPLTHYFSLGALIALAAYVALRLRGKSLAYAGAAFCAATSAGVILWAHQFLLQRANFSGGLVDWLHEPSAHPSLTTLSRIILLPGRYLSDTSGVIKMVSTVGALLFFLPLFFWRRSPEIGLWWIWLVGTIAPVAFLDFSQHNKHLSYIRYTLLASPGVYALLATSGNWLKIKWIVPALAAIWCAIALPLKAYHPAWRPDWRGAFQTIAENRRAGEAVCCVAPHSQDIWEPDAVYIELNYYLRPLPESVILLRDPPLDPNAPTFNDLTAGRAGVWAVVTGKQGDPAWVPDSWKLERSIYFPEIGLVEHLQPTTFFASARLDADNH